MRQRRDPFARIPLIPEKSSRLTCDWCGTPRGPGRPIRDIRQETDGGTSQYLSGAFCSWSCAESYHDQTLAR